MPPPFWSLVPSIEAIQEVGRLMDYKPPRFNVDIAPLSAEYFEFLSRQGWGAPAGLMDPVPDEHLGPPVKLYIDDPSFSQDYVYQGGCFCSQHARSAFNLPVGSVQYLSVLTEGSSKNVVEKNYKMMNILAFSAVVDLDRSLTIKMPLDQLGRPGPERVIAVRKVVFREGAGSEFPLFRDPFDQRIYVTDEFATRVLKAGIPDLAFVDVTTEPTPGDGPPLKAL